MNQNLLKKKFITKLKKLNLKLCIAESVTGGRFIYEFIKKKGASSYIDYSLVCYSNNSKSEFLGLSDDLKNNDVISKIIAEKMAINITKFTKNKNVMGISFTGLASESKKKISKMKVGTVFYAVYYKNKVKAKKKVFENLTRNQIISGTIKEMIVLCNSLI